MDWTNRAALAGAAFTVFTACSGDERPAPIEDYLADYEGCTIESPCDILEAACESRLFELSRCIWDAPEAEQPPVRLLDEQETVDYLSGLVDAGGGLPDEEAFIAVQEAMRLIGLQESAHTLDEAIMTEVEGILALYTYVTGEVIVVDRGESTADATANFILCHEFIHALQDQRFDFESINAGIAQTDSQLAFQAVTEGNATLYHTIAQGLLEDTALSPVDIEDGFGRIAREIERQSLTDESPLEGSASAFPYYHGGLYMVRALIEGGRDATKLPFADRPELTRDILAGDPADRVAAPPFSDMAPFEPLPGYTLVGADRLGAWYAFLLASRTTMLIQPARDLVLELEDDQAFVYRDAAGVVALVWILDWSTSEAARNFAALIASPSTGDWDVGTNDNRVIITVADTPEATSAWTEHVRTASSFVFKSERGATIRRPVPWVALSSR